MRLFISAVVAAVLLVGPVSVAQADVLIAGSHSQEALDDIKDKVEATGLIVGNVETHDLSTSLPSLSDLQDYEAVLVYTNTSLSDPVEMGDVLADYVDSGGRVVVAPGANHDGQFGLQGRFLTEDYAPLGFGPTTSSPLTLGTITVEGHPLLHGVSSFDGGSFNIHIDAPVTSGARLVAEWSNGTPLIAEHAIGEGRVVSLNFFPVSDDESSGMWDPNTDGGVILANALNFGSSPLLVTHGGSSSSFVEGLLGAIWATEEVSQAIDTFNANADTPALSFLQQFEAVLVYDDHPFDDATAMGDTFADFVDAGGRVVIASGITSDFHGISLDGRWEAEGYAPLSTGTHLDTSATLGTVQIPTHPLMENVNTFDGGDAPRGDSALAPGSTLVASWSTGEPLVAYHSVSDNLVVALNFYPVPNPPSTVSWDVNTDGGFMLANALQFEAPRLRLERPTGNVIPHESQDDIGSVAQSSQSLSYTIVNEGTATLELNAGTPVDVSAQNNCTVDIAVAPSLSIDSGTSTTFELEVTPSGEGAFSATVTIASDDPAAPAFEFIIAGAADADSTDSSDGGGCSTGDDMHTVGWLLMVLLALTGLTLLRRNV